MAKIKKQNLINTVFLSQMRKTLELALLVAITCALVYFLAIKNQFASAGAVVLVALLLGRRMLTSIAVLRSGAKGESEALSLLLKLPKGYMVLPDCTISFKGHDSQVDYIVISDQAVLLLESKNISGTVTGDMRAKNLFQKKYRNGVIYEEKVLYNPFLQVKGHAKTLQNILSTAQIDVPIITAVYFSNHNASVKMDLNGENMMSVNDKISLEKQVQTLMSKEHGEVPQKKVQKLILR